MATKSKGQRLPTSGKDVAALLLQIAFVVVISVALYQEWTGRERSPMSAEDFEEALAEAEVRSPAAVEAVHGIVGAYEADQAQSFLSNDPLGMVPTELNRHGLVDALDEIVDLPGATEVSRCAASLAEPASDLQLHLALSVLLQEGAPTSALDDVVNLALHHGDSFMRRMAVGVAAKLGPRAGRSFANKLSHEGPRVREAAARGVAAVECSQGVASELQAALGDESPEVFVRCAAKLVSMGDGTPATVAALIAGISAKSESLRSLSLTALGSLPSSAGSVVVGPLLEACSQKDAEVRWQSGQALSSLGEEALPALLEASAGDDPRARFWATRALGHVPNPSDAVIAALVARLDDSDVTVHTEAAKNMGAVLLAGGSLAGVKAETLGVSGMALTALLSHERVPSDIDGALVNLLRDAEPLRQMLGISAAVALSCAAETVLAELTSLSGQQDTSAGRLASRALGQLR